MEQTSDRLVNGDSSTARIPTYMGSYCYAPPPPLTTTFNDVNTLAAASAATVADKSGNLRSFEMRANRSTANQAMNRYSDYLTALRFVYGSNSRTPSAAAAPLDLPDLTSLRAGLTDRPYSNTQRLIDCLSTPANLSAIRPAPLPVRDWDTYITAPAVAPMEPGHSSRWNGIGLYPPQLPPRIISTRNGPQLKY